MLDLEEFMSLLNNEFANQNLENMGAVVDNTGKLVVSNAETEDEYILEDNSVKSITGLIKFIIENGFKIDEETVKNFSENMNFGVLDIGAGKTLGGGKGTDKGNEIRSKLDSLIQDILKSTSFVEEKLRIFVEEKQNALEAIKNSESKANLFEEINKSFEFIGKVNKDIKKVEKKLEEDSSYQDHKAKKEILEKEGLDGEAEDTDKIENDSKKKWYADYKKLKEERDSLDDNELSARLESLKKRKQALGFSENKNFDDSSKYELGILKIKGKLGEIVTKSIEELKESKKKIDELVKHFKKDERSRAEKRLGIRIDKWGKAVDQLSNYLTKISKTYKLENAEKELKERKDKTSSRIKELESEFEDTESNRKDVVKLLKEVKDQPWEKVPKVIEAAQDFADDQSDETEKVLTEKLKRLGANEKLIKAILNKLSSNGLDLSDKDEETPKLDLSDKEKEEISKLDSNESSKEDEKKENDTDNSEWDERYQKYVEKMKKDKKTPKGKDKWIKEMKSMGFSEFTSFSDILNNMTSKMVTNFDAHQVKDSDYGIVWEDKFGSLWSENPDENGDADLLWESKEGKEQPTESVTEESDNTMSDDEMDDSLGMESDEEENSDNDLDMDMDSDSEDDLSLDDDTDLESDDNESESESDDLDFSEDDDLDLDLDSEDDDLSLDDESDEDLDLDDNEEDSLDLDDNENSDTTENKDSDMSKALDVIQSMYNKLIDKL